jgi:staphyloferrin B biosynthesis citrate synthase
LTLGEHRVANQVKDKIATGQVAYGIWAEAFDPDLIELCGILGFGHVVFDGEDTIFDHRHASMLFRTCELVDMVPIVRIPELNPSIILRYLELGAKGIYVPHVRTADIARMAVEAVRFPPAGRRPAASSRWAQFGVGVDLAEVYRQANEDIMVIALIEEPDGISHLDDIMAVEGVDVFGVGPGDLSLNMGKVGRTDDPSVRDLVVESEEKIRAAGKVFDAVVGTPEEARDCVERGALMVNYALRDMVLTSGQHFLRELAEVAPGSAVRP